MNQPTRQIQCRQCGAVCVLSEAELRWAHGCTVCGADFSADQLASSGPAQPMAAPLARPIANATPVANPDAALPLKAQPVESEKLGVTASDGPIADEAEYEPDDEYQVSWLAENALLILAMTALLAIAGIVVGLAWGGFQFKTTAESGSELPENSAAEQTAAPATLVDASTSSVRRNGVKVKILGADWDRLWAKDETNQVVRSEQLLMSVRLQITNQIEQPRSYTSWRADSGARLDDSLGNVYQAISLDSWKSVKGATSRSNLAPGNVVEDIVAFQPLKEIDLEQIEWLRVRLPAAVYEGEGEYYFQIPRKMIQGPSENPSPPNWDDTDPLTPANQL